MRLGILKCDNVQEALAVKHGQYPDMFAKFLHLAASDIELVVFDAYNEILPTDIHEVDAYLMTGSHYGVNDGFPWISQLEDFVRTLHVAQKKLIGICFGHQLIAKALGGVVIKSPKGWGIGMSQNQMVQEKQWMVPVQSEFNLLVSHQDQVIELPKEAQILASSAFCPNYMMQVGSHFFSIQGHPEFTIEYARDLILSKATFLDEKIVAFGIKSLESNPDSILLAQWIVSFLRGN